MKAVLHLLIMVNYVVGGFLTQIYGGQLPPDPQNSLYRLRMLYPLGLKLSNLNRMVIAYAV